MSPFADLLHYAHTRDPQSLERLAWHYEGSFVEASKLALQSLFGCGCLGAIFILPALIRLGWIGLAFGAALIALVPLLYRVDKFRWRRYARRSLRNGEPQIYRKVRIGEIADGAEMFQSYWKRDPGDENELELDHPIGLLEPVQQADEWWQWKMDVPHRNDNRLRPTWSPSYFELGLVRRRADGTPELVAGGQVYYGYDPWGDKLEKW